MNIEIFQSYYENLQNDLINLEQKYLFNLKKANPNLLNFKKSSNKQIEDFLLKLNSEEPNHIKRIIFMK